MKNKFWIKIQNKGEVDLNGLHLMGVSSKRDEEKIGFFGSGNKYSIALLLRNKIPFKIFSGTKEIKITTEPVLFRGQMFEKIIINGEKTSLTTSMGIDWENWFAIRELYCNALDEGEATISVDDSIKKEKGRTTIYISLTDEFGEFFKDIKSYILVNEDDKIDEVVTRYGDVSIFPSKEQFICYRKGIRIFPKNTIKSLYRYNFSNMEINESRVYKYEHEVRERIASYFAVSENREVILNYLNNWRDHYEKNASWEYVNDNFSLQWHSLLKGKRIFPLSLAIDSGDFESKHNSFIVPDELAKKIEKEIEDCEVVGGKGEKKYIEIQPTEEENKKIERAKMELKEIGYDITSLIKMAKSSMNDVVGWYDRTTDTIYLTRNYLTTNSEIKNTLLEEHFHSKGLNDGQRSFVTFLIDEIINSKQKNG